MKLKRLFWVVCVGLVVTSCNNDDGPAPVPLDNEVNDFVWKGMNLYYYWQEDVPNLADDRFTSEPDLFTYLNDFVSPETLFESLQFSDDRFSWITSDYVELDNSFQGISKSFGYEFRVARTASSSDDLFGYVEYVVPNSPASEAGLVRGDLFLQVDGTQLTIDNYRGLLFESEAYELSLAQFDGETFTLSGEKRAMTAIELTENPIYLSKTFDIQGTQVGYLVYNQFVNNNEFHRELNDVVGSFKNAGISELVLDLRYNLGGSLTTTRILGSMMYGAADANTVFGSIIYNSKLSQFDTDLSFLEAIPISGDDNEQTGTEPMNRLNIDHIYILISGSTASASELIIAGLLPYMDVTLIGSKTVGKNVGSVTLYDSPEQFYLSNEVQDINPNHTYAMQPIVSQLANSEGFTDYINGFQPDVELNEIDFIQDLKPLGDPEEPLLGAALNAIGGGPARVERPSYLFDWVSIIASRARKTHLQTILLDSDDVPTPLFTLGEN